MQLLPGDDDQGVFRCLQAGDKLDAALGAGESMRVAREAAGLSLSVMAARTHFTRGHLSNVETGKRPASRDVVLAYVRVLGDDVDRRGMLAGMAAGVVAPMATAELLLTGFSAAIGDRPLLDEWRERVERYGYEYMTVGASELQPRLARDLVVVQQQLDSPERWSVAARLLALYAKTTPGARESGRWYNLAVVAADRSEDRLVRAWVRGRAALAMAYEGKGLVMAGRLADQAVALSGSPSLGTLNAVVAQAHVAACGGDSAGALATLERAERMFESVISDEQISDYAVPEWRFHTFTSMLLSRMGDERRAVMAQEAADRTRPKSLQRFATHIEMHRGLMMAKAGDVDGGLAYARSAMAKLPTNRQSLTLRMLLAEVEQA
jgi:transcriptional regulator with XRE-family HTH domain